MKRRLVSSWSFVNKRFLTYPEFIYLLKVKEMHISKYFTAKFLCCFGIVWHGDFVYSKQYHSSMTETKREAILFCSEVNSNCRIFQDRGTSQIAKENIAHL